MRLLFFGTSLSLLLISFQMMAAPLSRDQVAEKLAFYRKIKSLQVTFEQKKTFVDMPDVTLESTGHLELNPPDRVLWTIETPSFLSVHLQKETVEIKSAENKPQVYKRSDARSDSNRNMDELVAWLRMNPDELTKHYEISSTAKDTYAFVPKDKSRSPFQRIETTLTSEGHVRKLSISEKSGDLLEISFGKPKVELTQATDRKP